MILSKRADIDFSDPDMPIQYDNTIDDVVNPRFVIQASTPSGYTAINTIYNWGNYGRRAINNYKIFRNEFLSEFPLDSTTWADYTDADKKILIEHYLYDSSETETNLNALVPKSERDKFRGICIDELKYCGCLIIVSSDNPDVYIHVACLASTVLGPKVITTNGVV